MTLHPEGRDELAFPAARPVPNRARGACLPLLSPHDSGIVIRRRHQGAGSAAASAVILGAAHNRTAHFLDAFAVAGRAFFDHSVFHLDSFFSQTHSDCGVATGVVGRFPNGAGIPLVLFISTASLASRQPRSLKGYRESLLSVLDNR